jgi:lycopene cyclase domain-containing protein
MHVWAFNPKYLMGIYLCKLPLEEILFFLLIPYCLSFMHHCLPLGISISKEKFNFKLLNIIIGIIILMVGIISTHQLYTGFTFLLTGLFFILISLQQKIKINWLQFWVTYLLGLIPFFIVNGLLTSIPIVTYNNAENLGIRLITIPIEDTIYNLLLFAGNIVGMQILKIRIEKHSS